MEDLNFYITFQRFRELGTSNSFLPNAEHLVFMKPKISYINLIHKILWQKIMSLVGVVLQAD